MRFAAIFVSLALTGVYALPAQHVRRANWLTTTWDVIVVGELLTGPPVDSIALADQIVISGAGPAGIIVAERMAEGGKKT